MPQHFTLANRKRLTSKLTWGIVVALAVGHALWPLLHFFWLVKKWDINPWRWGGYAMYSQVNELKRTRILIDGDVELREELETAAIRAKRIYYTAVRDAWGLLVNSQPLAELVSWEFPQISKVVIRFERAYLRPGSGVLALHYCEDVYGVLLSLPSTQWAKRVILESQHCEKTKQTFY